jgi:hypothetical protein
VTERPDLQGLAADVALHFWGHPESLQQAVVEQVVMEACAEPEHAGLDLDPEKLIVLVSGMIKAELMRLDQWVVRA